MKQKALIVLMAILALTVFASAQDNAGKTGIGIRGGLISPMFEGKDFNALSGNEPFMMGFDFGVDIKRYFNDRLALCLSVNYATTYDDTSAEANSDQSFKFANKDNAYSKLTGILGGLTLQYTLTSGKFQPYVLGGVGVDFWTLEVLGNRADFGPAIEGDQYKFSDFNVKVGLGSNIWFGEKMAFNLQGVLSYGLDNLTTPDVPMYYGGFSDWDSRPFQAYFEPSVGLTYYFGGKKDTDKDGVPDKLDNCPDTPIGAIVDANGCPLDSDGDGIFDGLDQCGDTPKGCMVDILGCPIDNDKDGVCDGVDKCPDTPLGVKVDVKGCPLDGDGDGVPDYRDKQLDTPRGAKVDQDGVGIDSDKDGVYDGLDKCPGTPTDLKVDADGCPIEVKRLETKITLNIKYATGSYEPDAASKVVLDSLVRTMYAFPDLRIRIDGFTDDVGKEAANMKLSQNRAEGVMKYLVSKGVDATRMESKGFGEDPNYFVGDNKTPEGRQKNRRVEIDSIKQQ